MNRLNEWKRRINATDFPDKQKACDGLDRIWATGEGGLSAEGDQFAGVFYWADTDEGRSFWGAVNSKLESANTDIIGNVLVDEPSSIQQLIDAAKRYKRLRDLAERAEGEL